MKFLITLSVLLSSSLLAQVVSSSVNQNQSTGFLAKERFIPRLAVENVELKEYRSGSNIEKLDRDSMSGINIGVAYELNLGGRLSAYTIPNFSYVRDSSNTSSNGSWNYVMKNKTYKINQTFNISFESGTTLIQPYIGVGFGYAENQYIYTFVRNSNFTEEFSYKGTLVEGNAGIQFHARKWVPFLQYTTRKHNVSDYEYSRSWGSGVKESPQDVNYRVQVVTIGTGYRF